MENTPVHDLARGGSTDSQKGAFARAKMEVIKTIHPRDGMFNLSQNAETYFETGRAALMAIQSAIALSGSSEVKSILDFGCGYGRVGRWLRAAYPVADLIGSELSKPAVDFYAETFRASGWQTSALLDNNKPGKTFDVIWAGSVITHLPEVSVRTLIKQFISWLNKDGIAVFSSNGRVATKVMKVRKGPNKTEPSAFLRASEDFLHGQFGFAPYLGQQTYGTSFIPARWFLDWLDSMPNVRLVVLSEAGWRGHQDVIAVQKRPASAVGTAKPPHLSA